MVALLTQLIGSLSETIQAWEGFWGTEKDYFLYDGEVPTASSSLKLSLIAINKDVSKLMSGLWKLEALKKELCEGSPHGVSHLHDSAFGSELHPSA